MWRLGVNMWNSWLKKDAYKESRLEISDSFKGAISFGKNKGWITDVADEWRQYIIGTMMINQWIMNACNRPSDLYPRLPDISLLVVKKIWSESLLPDIVSVQPMSNPTLRACFRQGYEYKREEVSAKTRKLRANYNPSYFQDLRVSQEESIKEFSNYLSEEIKLEITREVITDIRNSAGLIVKTFDFKESIDKAYDNLSSRLKKYYGEYIEPNWMIRGPMDGDNFANYTSLGIYDTNTYINNMKVYIDPLFPLNQAIMGYKGNEYESSYIYSPYVSIVGTQVVLDPDSFCTCSGILTRYSKKLVANGAKVFARVYWGLSE
jgi:Major capsid protein Gp23